MTEKIQINRHTVYLSIENVRFETEEGIQVKENQFIAFFKLDPVNEISLGEQIKNDKGENLVFNSVEEARNTTSEILRRKIYPPSFFNPMEYTAENLMEIMHKNLTFDIGNFNSDEIQESINGIITNCTLASASNPANMPYSVRIITDNGERRLRISELKRIRR